MWKREGPGGASCRLCRRREGPPDTGTDSPRSLQEDQPHGPLDFSPGYPCWTSDPEDRETTNLCCFKPLDLWGSVPGSNSTLVYPVN